MILIILLLNLACINFIVAATSETSISTSAFDEAIVKQSSFIDKTQLLGEFFKFKQGPDYNYVSYPSKFGKTINLQMINRFCQVHLNCEKKPLNCTQTESYHLFNKLKIAQNRDVFSTHLAQHPVIWLDLNFTLKGVITEGDVIAGINQQIKKCYSEYEWLIELAKKSRTYFYHESMQNALEGALSGQQMVDGLLHLARLLNDYFKVGVVLLIDNYDLVLNTLYVGDSESRMVLKPLTRAMVKACLSRGEHYVSHAFIAGVSLWNYNLKDDESSSNEPSISVQRHHFLLDTRFSGYFGFTEPEIQSICDQYKCTKDEKWLLKQLYDGYTNPTLFQSGLKSLYNPYSVTEFIAHRQEEIPFRNYWIRSQDAYFIYGFLRELHFRKQFVELLKYESIIIGDRESIQTSYWTVDHLKTWYEPYNSSLLGYVFDSGYLTYDSKDFNRIRIPNDDIKLFLSSVLIKFYKSHDYEIDKLRKCLDRILVDQIADSEQPMLNLKQHLLSTLKLINTRDDLQLKSIFKPELVRLEVLNILMTVALEMRLTGKEILVARMSRRYPDHDHILLYDRNETLIVRVKDKLPVVPELPSALHDALLPAMSKMRVKILDVMVNNQIEMDVALREYKDNSSYSFSPFETTTRKIALETLFPA